jgi:hypothetical protein
MDREFLQTLIPQSLLGNARLAPCPAPRIRALTSNGARGAPNQQGV